MATPADRTPSAAQGRRLFWWFWWCGVTFKRDGRGVAVGLTWPPVRRFVDCQLSQAERKVRTTEAPKDNAPTGGLDSWDF